ncbi:MAG TPA: lytic transglycosylase domain-containing protein [Solirubrobacteraceae bacterium]|jgi:soluble lytic murein transglycosylase-like protein
MSGEALTAGSIGPAEASSAATRIQQLQELIAKSATATTASGESSFAAALQAANAEGGGPPEAPEPPQAPEVGPGETGGTAMPASASYASSPSPYASMATYSPVSSSPLAAYSPASATSYPATSPYSTSPYTSAPYTSATYAPTSTYSSSSLATGEGVSGASAYAGMVEQAALQNGVEPALLMGLIQQESGFDPSAQSGAGAMGLTQLMPSTAASLGVTEPLNPEQSISGGARLLGQLLRQFGGNASDALAAYNAGAGAVEQYGGIPPYPETEAYVTKVLANAQSFRGGS